MNNSTDFFLVSCRCLYCFPNDLLTVLHVRVQLYLFLNLQSVLVQTQLSDTALSTEGFSPLQGCSLQTLIMCEHIFSSCVVWVVYEVLVSFYFPSLIGKSVGFLLGFFSWYLDLEKPTREIIIK